MSRGRVILVGAGPGAPDLITLRGVEALRRADAVVYDALASPALLDYAPAHALRINVGKRGHDAPTVPQEETTALLLRLAAEGKTVVRLKGGDPYVFGRGGEEGTACAEAGIPLEVVPGVSSIFGALAYAGIPVTDRRHAASFAVVTGHKDPSKAREETRWEALARGADTLLVLMGMRNLAEIVAKLVEGGRAADTPAAVVMQGTLPGQRVVEAPLAELPERVARAGIGSPAVVVVGGVVGLRSALAWYERQPLFGRRVLVTRAPEQATAWVSALASAGAEAVVMPLLRILPPEDPAPLDAALAALGDFDVLLLTSPNAVRATASRAAALSVPLAAARRVVCVGPRTAEAAREAGLPVHLVPEQRFEAEGVLEAVREAFTPQGLRFLLPRSALARDALPEGLREAGAAEVVSVTAYRNEEADVDEDALRASLRAGALDVLSFASPSAARRFAALLDDAARDAARRCVVAAIGPVTAEALRGVGLPADYVAPRPDPESFVAGLAAHVAGDAETG